MTTEITMDNVLPLLKAAVDTRGEDYCYRDEFHACRYVINNQPACLIGVMLAQNGASVGVLAQMGGLVDSLFHSAEFLPDFSVTATTDAQSVMQAAQSHQDNGSTWGDAYAAAVKRHAELASPS